MNEPGYDISITGFSQSLQLESGIRGIKWGLNMFIPNPQQFITS
jgi:hypothetical protein